MYNNIFGEIFKEFDFPNLGISSVFITIALVYCFIMFGIGIVLYILRALGIYKMSKNSGINNPWISFIPFINCYTFGKLAEKYKKRDGTNSAKFSIILLILQIISVVSAVLCMVFSFKAVIEILKNADKAVGDNTKMTVEMFSSLIPAIALLFVMTVIMVAFAVVRYVALWRIFSSFDYTNATVFTVVSIILSFLEPIFLFIIRNKPSTFEYKDRMGQYMKY